jgi:hypothetical protein
LHEFVDDARQIAITRAIAPGTAVARAVAMARSWAFVVVAGACSFAPIPGGESAAPDAAAVATAQCSVSDPSLKLCIDFTEPISPTMTVHDLSGLGHDATATMIAATSRTATDQAVLVSATSTISIAPASDLMLGSPLTIELWLDPTLPSDNGAYVLDGGAYYSIKLNASGHVSCQLANASASSTAIGAGAWSHVACVYDGTTLQVFVDGSVAGCQTQQPTPVTGPTAGMSIASRMTSATNFSQQLVGGIDDVHVFASALSPATICAHAGNATCTTTCPSGGGG